MPLSINVGLNRKSSKDYQSQGQSINIEAELDSMLLTKPAELQRQIAALYEQAELALQQAAMAESRPPVVNPHPDRVNGKPNGQVNSQTHGQQPPPANGSFNSRTNGHANGPSNGQSNGQSNGHAGTPAMTDSQRRAIGSIAQRQRLDAETICQDEFGCTLNELSVRNASKFIELLLNNSPETANRKAGVR